jgi:hypothetical protein
MSAKAWMFVGAIGAFWFLCHIVLGFPGSAVELAGFKKCMAEMQAANQEGTENLVYDTNSREMVRINSDHTTECEDSVTDPEAAHRQMAFFVTPIYFLAAGGVHLIIRRRKKEVADEGRRAALHREVLDTVTAQTRTEIIMGDVYKNITNSNLIVRSSLRDAIQKNDIENPDLSIALGEIAKVVANSGNKDAADHLNLMTAELAKPEPSKSVVRTFWSGLKELVPLVKDSVEAVAAIEKFVG